MSLIIVPKRKTNVLASLSTDSEGNLLVNGEPVGNKLVQIATNQEVENMLDEIFGDNT